MNDEANAISHLQLHPQALQDKLAHIKFTNPATGHTHSWQKSQYIKSLARKIHDTIGLISSE